jgi:hypothetical protein
VHEQPDVRVAVNRGLREEKKRTDGGIVEDKNWVEENWDSDDA